MKPQAGEGIRKPRTSNHDPGRPSRSEAARKNAPGPEWNPEKKMKRYHIESGLVTRDIGGETIVVPVAGHVCDLEAVYTLNEAGSAIWRLLETKSSLEEIVAAICERYDVTPAEARRDAIELIASLEAAGLVHAVDEA